MRLLVNKEECNAYLGVSFHKKETDFQRYVRQAQLFDIKPLVCEDFFEDLTSETPQGNYEVLLGGGNYSYKGRNYHFQGLKAVISYFLYARYLMVGHQTDTPFGVKEKNYQDGLQISNAERRDTKTMYMQNAYLLWEECKKYLQRNQKEFPKWENCNTDSSTHQQPKTFRLKLV